MRKTQRNNTSGQPGVSELRTGYWRASIGRDGRRIFLGNHFNRDLAVKARQAAEQALSKDT